jgi:hypothetical protein
LTPTNNLSCGLTGITTGHGCLAIIVSSAVPTSITGWGTLLYSNGSTSSPIINVYRYQAPSGSLTVTASFSPTAYCAIYVVETTALSFTATPATGGNTQTASGSTPPGWLVQTGDLPFGVFASSIAASVTTQGGWTQACNLNSTGSDLAQLQVQVGPTATTTPQNVTATATFGTGFAYGGLLIAASATSGYVFDSQVVVETADTDTANARVSQVAIETLDTDTANAHVSQYVMETADADTANARISQWVMEVIVPLNVRVSQLVAETLDIDTANLRMSQLVGEVMFSATGARRRTVDDEWFTF